MKKKRRRTTANYQPPLSDLVSSVLCILRGADAIEKWLNKEILVIDQRVFFAKNDTIVVPNNP